MNSRRIRLAALALTVTVAGAKAVVFATNTTLTAGDKAYDGQDIGVSKCTQELTSRQRLLPHFADQCRADASVPLVGVVNNRFEVALLGG